MPEESSQRNSNKTSHAKTGYSPATPTSIRLLFDWAYHGRGSTRMFRHSIARLHLLVIASLFVLANLVLRPDALAEIPQTRSVYPLADVRAAVERYASQKKSVPELSNANIRAGLTRYMSFLAIDPADEVKFENQLTRLMNSSTQFIYCDDNDDWQCLESPPQIQPLSEFRRETESNLGAAVSVRGKLNTTTYFTHRWAEQLRRQNSNSPSLASILGGEIRDHATRGLSMALYGMDDLDGSMAPVYNAIKDKLDAGIRVGAVFDAGDEASANHFLRKYDVIRDSNGLHISLIDDIDFSYVRPRNTEKWMFGHPSWMALVDGLSPETTPVDMAGQPGGGRITSDLKWLMDHDHNSGAQRIGFQYRGSSTLIQLINSQARTNEEAQARIEFPMNAIMHNKFLVMDSGRDQSVWTGTANVARTCMGEEVNSNMAVVIRNDEVAQVFEDEFREMHEFDSSNAGLAKAPNLITGRFHRFKRPNTQRYFRFAGGDEVRVHFAPTDDGEHRAIIPFLLSAKKGDIVRISMFSGSGIEFVRAMQYAASQGAHVRVLLDNKSGLIPNGWLRNKVANLFDENPYSPNAEPIEVHLSAWPRNGMNHYKAGSLTRMKIVGGRSVYVTESLIVGSQNWSALGNDTNDENMLSFRNLQHALVIGDEFNAEFDKNLWSLSRPITGVEAKTSTQANQDEDDR